MLKRNVLIFHLGALGDFILTWPFALALSRIYPQSRIIYVTHGEKARLAEKVLRLESSDVESGWHALFADQSSLPARAEHLLTGAHAVYSFLSPSPTWITNVHQLNPHTKLTTLKSFPSDHFSGHASQWLLDQLKEHPIERAALEQILRSVQDRGISFPRAAGSDIVIHPGSGSPTKCWPLENFLELATKFRENGRHVRFLTGEVERDRWSVREFQSIASVADIHHPKSYLDLLGELSTSHLFIGNDSGPGHLAAIIGVPTLSIFTTTNPQCWQPLGPRVRVANNPTVDAVFELAS